MHLGEGQPLPPSFSRPFAFMEGLEPEHGLTCLPHEGRFVIISLWMQTLVAASETELEDLILGLLS